MKGVRSGIGSGSIGQRYGSGVPDPHQNVTGSPKLLLTWFSDPGGGGDHPAGVGHHLVGLQPGLEPALSREVCSRKTGLKKGLSHERD
jgi:hypothetical protein